MVSNILKLYTETESLKPGPHGGGRKAKIEGGSLRNSSIADPTLKELVLLLEEKCGLKACKSSVECS